MSESMNQAKGLFGKLGQSLAEMPAKSCFNNEDYTVQEAQLAFEMRTATDVRADMNLKITTAKKKLGAVWFRMPEGNVLGVKQDRTRTLKFKRTPEYFGGDLPTPLAAGASTTIQVSYRFTLPPLGMIPLPLAPLLRYELTVTGKGGAGYDLIFPGSLQDMVYDRGFKTYTWLAPKPYQLHLFALTDPQRYMVEKDDYAFYFYHHPLTEPCAKEVAETLADSYLAQVKLNGPLPYRDYYLFEVSPKMCPAPVGLGGIILVPAGIFKNFNKAHCAGVIENELLKEWKGRKGEQIREVR